MKNSCSLPLQKHKPLHVTDQVKIVLRYYANHYWKLISGVTLSLVRIACIGPFPRSNGVRSTRVFHNVLLLKNGKVFWDARAMKQNKHVINHTRIETVKWCRVQKQQTTSTTAGLRGRRVLSETPRKCSVKLCGKLIKSRYVLSPTATRGTQGNNTDDEQSLLAWSRVPVGLQPQLHELAQELVELSRTSGNGEGVLICSAEFAVVGGAEAQRAFAGPVFIRSLEKNWRSWINISNW